MRVAVESGSARNRHGAVVVKNGNVVSVGVNKFRNDPRVIPSDKPNRKGTIFSVHAEVDALSRVANPRGSTIYVALAGPLGPKYSRPCEGCMQTLARAGVKKVVYTRGTIAGDSARL